MIQLVNLTPHELNIRTKTGEIISIPPSGGIARVAEKRENLGAYDGIGISRATYGEVDGLPEPVAGVFYIVSALVLQAVPDRADVFAPGPAIRDEQGRVIGADGLSATPAYTPIE